MLNYQSIFHPEMIHATDMMGLELTKFHNMKTFVFSGSVFVVGQEQEADASRCTVRRLDTQRAYCARYKLTDIDKTNATGLKYERGTETTFFIKEMGDHVCSV